MEPCIQAEIVSGMGWNALLNPQYARTPLRHENATKSFAAINALRAPGLSENVPKKTVPALA